MQYVRIPQERIGALIGHNGQTKKELEERTGTKITVDSNDGNVKIEAVQPIEDPIQLWKARDVIRAIGRGFSPQNAFKLLNEEESYLEIISLKDYVRSSRKSITRVKGRIIGAGGKTRKIIEETTQTRISVYGDTIAIIGNVENLLKAKEAAEMLIKGAEHSTVYRILSSYRYAKK